MAPKVIPPRIFGIVASEAPVAVIFRRGPSKQTQMLTWNLETNEVIAGQWIKGRVFFRRCDLSPDGTHLVGAFSNYSRRQYEAVIKQYNMPEHYGDFWTAVSKPPYYSAIGLWFLCGSYNGGGTWIDNRHLGFNNQPYAYFQAKPLRGFKVTELHLEPGEDRSIWNLLLEKRRWELSKPYQYLEGHPTDGPRKKVFPRGEIHFAEQAVAPDFLGSTVETWDLRDRKGNVVRAWENTEPDTVWIDVDHRGRLLIGDQGCLWVWEDFPTGEPRMIIDLSGNVFEEAAPPY